jgi:hypothetical protein
VFPNLITTVATTDATVTGNQMTEPVHHALATRNLAPGRHYTDSGYLSAALVASAHVYMACALDLLRLEAFWTGTPLDRQRTSPPGTTRTRPRRIELELTRIDFAGKAIDGLGCYAYCKSLSH